MKEFIEDVKAGYLIDYDGYGYYAGKDWQTDIVVKPSMVLDGTIDTTFSHIMWYNR